MEEQFKIQKLNVQFVDSFAAKLNDVYITSDSFTKGMVGCYITHERLIEEIKRNDYGVCLVMEDDIKLQSGFKEYLDVYIEQLPEDWDIAFVGWNSSGAFISKDTTLWRRLTAGFFWGFFCYLVNGKKGAEKIHKAIVPMKNQIDLQVLEAIKRNELNAYVLSVKIISHDGYFPTTVQSDKNIDVTVLDY